MKYLSAIFLFLLAATGLCDEYQGWWDVAPAGSGFTVKMPGIAMHMSKKISEEGVSYVVHKYGVTSGQLFYTVGYADMSKITIPADQVDQLLQNFIGGMTKVNKGTLLQNEKAPVQNQPGRIYMVQSPDGRITLGMTCWDGKHHYFISLKGPSDAFKNDAARTYFKTFKMTNVK